MGLLLLFIVYRFKLAAPVVIFGFCIDLIYGNDHHEFIFTHFRNIDIPRNGRPEVAGTSSRVFTVVFRPEEAGRAVAVGRGLFRLSRVTCIFVERHGTSLIVLLFAFNRFTVIVEDDSDASIVRNVFVTVEADFSIIHKVTFIDSIVRIVLTGGKEQ